MAVKAKCRQIQAAFGSWVCERIEGTVWQPDREYGKIRDSGLSALSPWSWQKMCLGEGDRKKATGEMPSCVSCSTGAAALASLRW